MKCLLPGLLTVGLVLTQLGSVGAKEPVSGTAPASTIQLASKTNDFCWTMHKNHQNKEDFKEAYREAYELLQLAKQIDKLVESGDRGPELTELLEDFDSEIHHVENHLVAFTAENTSAAGPPDDSPKKLEEVEGTLHALMSKLGVRRKHADADKHAHEHATEAAALDVAVPFSKLTAALVTTTNDFCWSMHSRHKGKPDFAEAYQEAYELLTLAKQIDKLGDAKAQEQELIELLKDFDGEIHHVENHVTTFAAGQAVNLNTEEDSTVQILETVEGTLHRIMSQKGVQRQAKGGHEHGEEHKEDGPKPETTELAASLVEKLTLFCRSMKHNYKKNPDYKEAYGEAYELYEISVNIRDEMKANGITDDVRKLLGDFDSELHHVENHVKGFVADDDGNKDGPRRLGRKLQEVERVLHPLMHAAGVKRKHVDENEEKE